MAMDKLLELMAEKRASDLFITVGSPIQLKLNGVTVPVNQTRLEQPQVEALLREVVSERQWAQFGESQELNLGYGIKGVGSFRFSIFRQRGSTAAVMLTAGSALRIPHSAFDSTRTLALHFYILSREGISMPNAYATASVLIIAILGLNLLAYWLMRRFVAKVR